MIAGDADTSVELKEFGLKLQFDFRKAGRVEQRCLVQPKESVVRHAGGDDGKSFACTLQGSGMA